jgi:hypothetical protein
MMARGRRVGVSDAEAHLLSRIEAGETTFQPSSTLRAGETIETLVERLIALRDRGLVALTDTRILRSQSGRILGAGPCSLTTAGREALEHDRRLGPRP